MEKINIIFTIIDVIASVALAILAVLISKRIHDNEKKDSITTKTISCLTSLFVEYKKTMCLINEALKQGKELISFLHGKEKEDLYIFNEIYYSEKYNALREVHYFFELIGSLIKQDNIQKNTFWQYFSFPIEFFMETAKLRTYIKEKNCLPSYAKNFCFMFLYYNDWRNQNNMDWIVNGKKRRFSDEELIEYTGDFYYLFKKEIEKKRK